MKCELMRILGNMSRRDIVAFILWCTEHNYKVTPVSHCLWLRASREAARLIVKEIARG